MQPKFHLRQKKPKKKTILRASPFWILYIEPVLVRSSLSPVILYCAAVSLHSNKNITNMSNQKPNNCPFQDSAPSISISPGEPNEDDIFQQIRCCLDLDTLQFFVLSGAWVGNPAVWKAIQSRYEQLDPDGGFHKDLFACEEFWDEPMDSHDSLSAGGPLDEADAGS